MLQSVPGPTPATTDAMIATGTAALTAFLTFTIVGVEALWRFVSSDIGCPFHLDIDAALS